MRCLASGIIIAVLWGAVASAQPEPGFRPGPGGNRFPRHPFAPPPMQVPSDDMDQAGQQNAGNPEIDRNLPLTNQVDQSINRGVDYLLKRQRADGSWGGDLDAETGQDTGKTALVALALMSCGVSHQSPELTKALEFLKKVKVDEIHDQTYCIALRAAFYSQLPESIRKPLLSRDLEWLQQAMIKKGPAAGMYTYRKPFNNMGGYGDFSNSQYGVLGVWYAEMAGLEVPTRYWQQIEECWRSAQNPDGGWGYNISDGDSYASMTAAGLATLHITYDYLHSQQEVDLHKIVSHPSIDHGLQWLGDHFAVDINSGRDDPANFHKDGGDMLGNVFGAAHTNVRLIGTWVHYMLFGYERVGEATGLTRFGTHKWYDDGAKFLIDTQNYDGSWNSQPDQYVGTSYALLFESRGRSPVALQKLEFKGRWNNRSRDAASIVKWLTRETERHTNWQIVPVEASSAEMREAPILYVASDKALVLRESDKQRIKTYIDQGGLLLAVNEGVTKEFSDSIVALAKEFYPAYEFRNLPTDHLIYGENFPVKALPTVPRALSNGVRELMVLLPTGDMTWKFQQGAGTNNPAAAPGFSFFGNLYIYMNDKANPRSKGDDTWIDADPNAQDKNEISVARLKINANWNPEPMGWTRLANVLHNADGLKLTTAQIDPDTMLLPNTIPLADLTATNSFELSQTQQNVLKKYLDGGGLLVFDAAGGSTAAQISFETLLAKMYPAEKLKPLDINHPIYTGEGFGGTKIQSVTYRRYALERIAKTTLPRLRALEVNGKIVALDSPEDLSAGLVGYNIDGIVGYTPSSATAMMRNIVLWANSQLPPAK